MKIPIVGNPVDFTHEERSVQEKNGENVANRTDRPSDQEILESVDAKYFNESSNFDAGKYELQVRLLIYILISRIIHEKM